MAIKPFLDEDFLLDTETGRALWHEHAKLMPIHDYHCHLPPEQIAQNKAFTDLAELWLGGDHYKWRAMRTNGVPERFITGDAGPFEKFSKWAETVPQTLRNPLYHWTHLELRRYFGIEKLLSPATAREIWEEANAKLATPEFRVHGLIRRSNVKVICTTDDPIDSLEHHRAVAKLGLGTVVLPSFRPDKGMAIEAPQAWNAWVDRLGALTGDSLKDFDAFLAAIQKRHDFFGENGCRVSDRGLETAYAEDFSLSEIRKIFKKVRSGKAPDGQELLKFRSAMLLEFARMDHAKGWVMQIHIGAQRNNSTRMKAALGPDTGFDSIGDAAVAAPLAKFLDRLDQDDRLPKTILYNLNPRDNEVFATMIGNFQGGGVPGKIQFGSGWWFLDQKDGMERQMNALSSLGLLSRFVGMLTDSRSFVSYPRHEYFRRILCMLLGRDVEHGEIPADMELLGTMVRNISFHNAKDYFGIPIP